MSALRGEADVDRRMGSPVSVANDRNSHRMNSDFLIAGRAVGKWMS